MTVAVRTGSPPRMRGKLTPHATIHSHAGITPADAGKTRLNRRLLFILKDHPRGCGENPAWSWAQAVRAGSPPRMRGKLDSIVFVPCDSRITPADAGKTHLVGINQSHPRDHPRGCGENGISVPSVKTITGSPPRMRGKPSSDTRAVITCRITPADAGKTPSCDGRPPEYEDHPRGCGENDSFYLPLRQVKGSPPRMRGKLAMLMLCALRPGITPADAGKTSIVHAYYYTIKDHPRGCGENLPPVLLLMPQAGSPPRMRGKPSREEVTFFLPRITPAGAGKTVSR